MRQVFRYLLRRLLLGRHRVKIVLPDRRSLWIRCPMAGRVWRLVHYHRCPGCGRRIFV